MSRPNDPSRPDLYARVTDAIIAELERGVTPWTKPWSAEHLAGRISRPLRHNGEPYSGINVILLWSEAVARGFSAPTWMTFRQALALGGNVRKGEHGSTVVYANRIVRTEAGDDGQDIERQIPFLKAYTVFNFDQIEGLPAQFDPEAYYATLAHECTHWTSHPTRLDREFGRKRWGDDGYAREELVAELGAAFLCADLGLELEPRLDHASYIDHWLKVLADDRRFIFTAAAHAQRASDFLKSYDPA
jgi:antirestriction protein ArdC